MALGVNVGKWIHVGGQTLWLVFFKRSGQMRCIFFQKIIQFYKQEMKVAVATCDVL